MKYIGIDISKRSFTVAFSSENGSPVREYENSPKGIHKFISALSSDAVCVMEATGNYGTMLVYLLQESGFKMIVENPLKVKNFARAMMSVTKTDAIDARLLALYGERMQPSLYHVPGRELLLLKQKRTVLRQLKKQLTMSKNLWESIDVLPFVDPLVKKTMKSTIKYLEKEIKRIEESLASYTEEIFSQQFKLLTSVKGIGATLAVALIVATGAFTSFDNSKQLTKYLGLSPTYEQSGTSVLHRGHINRNGDSELRSQLYVAAWSAVQYNPTCKALYTRLRQKGKPGKLAMIAVANKLVRIAFSVVKNNVPYDINYSLTSLERNNA
ncbi:IS110 family transposase [Falsiporphyromonas endometrii]|uniref:IS110 family transposase n=1 Tax=Falsiporphyromonas endometrii TaxID=1387297 RepID=A0ABV9K847_9PORP